MGGGGNSVSNWNISPKLDTTLNGTYLKVLADYSLIVYGRPLSETGYTWYIVSRIDGKEIVSDVVYN